MRPSDVGRIEGINKSKSHVKPKPRIVRGQQGAQNQTDLLDQAIEMCDLPELILEHFPGANTIQGCFQTATRVRFCAVWRDEVTPSFDLTIKGDRWIWYDRGEQCGGNALTFLTHILKLSKRDAARYLIQRAGLSGVLIRHSPTNLDEQQRALLWRHFRLDHPNADAEFFDDFLEYEAGFCGLSRGYTAKETLAFALLESASADGLQTLAAVRHSNGLFEELDPVTVWALELLADCFADSFRPYLRVASQTSMTVKIGRLS